MKSMILFKIRRRILMIIAPLLSDKMMIKLSFRNKMGYWLDLSFPQTFCEKIQWLKLNMKRFEFTDMVDKVEAKKYVESIIGKEYIIPTIGVWNSFDEIDFSSLPDGYILKCTHDSSKGVVVKDASKVNIPLLKKRMNYYLRRTYFVYNREYPYKNVPHRIIAEKYLINGTDKELKDYKFYCFNGRALYCQLIADRSSDETIDFYNRDWVHEEFIGLNPKARHADNLLPKPLNYEEMLAVADNISTAINHPFVRIDLYNVNGKVFFGEITFFPGSGMGAFRPKEWDLKLGKMINI